MSAGDSARSIHVVRGHGSEEYCVWIAEHVNKQAIAVGVVKVAEQGCQGHQTNTPPSAGT
jgi:hypothetical protein